MEKIGSTCLRNEPSCIALENQDWSAAYRRFMKDDLPQTKRHEVSGTITVLMIVLGFLGWTWTFLVSL